MKQSHYAPETGIYAILTTEFTLQVSKHIKMVFLQNSYMAQFQLTKGKSVRFTRFLTMAHVFHTTIHIF